jgi:hypothetical protein
MVKIRNPYTIASDFIRAGAGNNEAGPILSRVDAATLQRLAPHVKGGKSARADHLRAEISAECERQIAKATALDPVGV